MQTYNAIIRLGGKTDNEVAKTALTTPEVLVLRKIHGSDAVVKVEPAGHWDEHYSTQITRNANHEEEITELEFDEHVERQRLAREYGDAIAQPNETASDAVSRLFGDFAPLPTELPEFKAQRRAATAPKPPTPAAPTSAKEDRLKKVS